MDWNGVAALIFIGFFFGFLFRKRLSAWLNRPRAAAAKPAAQVEIIPPLPFDQAALTARLYELDKIFGPFGSNAAHPSDLYAQAEFKEAVRLLMQPNVPLSVIMQFVEGNSWSLSSAGLAAMRKRPDMNSYMVQRVLRQCEHYAPWTMYFALEILFETEPHILVGEPVMRARDWWADNRWMPNIFRDYLERCSLRGDKATFGGPGRLKGLDASAKDAIKKFLERVPLQFAGVLAQELDLDAIDAADLDSSEFIRPVFAAFDHRQHQHLVSGRPVLERQGDGFSGRTGGVAQGFRHRGRDAATKSGSLGAGVRRDAGGQDVVPQSAGEKDCARPAGVYSRRAAPTFRPIRFI